RLIQPEGSWFSASACNSTAAAIAQPPGSAGAPTRPGQSAPPAPPKTLAGERPPPASPPQRRIWLAANATKSVPAATPPAVARFATGWRLPSPCLGPPVASPLARPAPREAAGLHYQSMLQTSRRVSPAVAD